MASKIYLDDIVYHPTFNCNLSCRGCINYSNHLETRKIPDESNWDRDLDILLERFDIRHIDIAGGETLMFPHLQEVLKKLTSVKECTVTTNGLLLHKNMWLKDLLDSDSRFRITISVHGHPMLESVYIKNLCESVGKFINISPEKFKKTLRQHFLSKTIALNRFRIYNNRIVVINHYKGSWAYPLMDENELPTQFNNSKELIYDFDVTHLLSVVYGWRISESYQVGGRWFYRSSFPYTPIIGDDGGNHRG